MILIVLSLFILFGIMILYKYHLCNKLNKIINENIKIANENKQLIDKSNRLDQEIIMLEQKISLLKSEAFLESQGYLDLLENIEKNKEKKNG